MVHTRVEVHRIDSEMSRLVERPWLQLMCCTICLLHSRNLRWREESLSGCEYWLVCRCWTPEVEFNKSLSSLIIRLVNYSVTTSLIYKLIVTNFIQLVSPQPVDRFSQTKLHWKAPNEGYPHMCGMYKSNNKWLRYQAISSCKSFVC